MFGALNIADLTFRTTAQESDAQMAMFDGLGPLARDALNDCPREPDVRTFIGAFTRSFNARYNASRFGNRKLVLTDPAVDAEFAAFIDGTIVEKMGESIAWHKLKPRRLARDRWRSRPIKLNAAPRPRSSHTHATRRLTRPSR